MPVTLQCLVGSKKHHGARHLSVFAIRVSDERRRSLRVGNTSAAKDARSWGVSTASGEIELTRMLGLRVHDCYRSR